MGPRHDRLGRGETGLTGVVDLVFPLAGATIAPDYALLLWRSLRLAAPWLDDEPAVGILPISGASVGDGILYLGHRAQLTLRLPLARLADADALCGLQLDLNGVVSIGPAHQRALRPQPAQYSPFVALASTGEEDFVAECGRRLEEIGIAARLICGRARTMRGEAGAINGFSLMLHGLTAEHSLRLQTLGLGDGRKLGCGIFVPHKTATAVGTP